jgi:hypothetical protein
VLRYMFRAHIAQHVTPNRRRIPCTKREKTTSNIVHGSRFEPDFATKYAHLFLYFLLF